jgi:surface antigen
MKSFLGTMNVTVLAVLLASGVAGCGLASSTSTSASMSQDAVGLAATAATPANLTNAGEPGTCLDADSNHYPSNGDNIQLWGCNTHPEQEWVLTASGQVKNASTGMCLDADSNHYPSNGDNIQLWGCNTHPEQEWVLTASGQVKNASTGMCLDADSNHYPSNGDNIQLWGCNTHPEQEWVLGSLTWSRTSGPSAASKYFGYPYPNAPACSDGGKCVTDKWNFYEGQCTSWVAYRLNELNGIAFTNQYRGNGIWGDASSWGQHAKSLGIPVNGTPSVGSVAWYSFGHVAYVDQVNSPTSVVISEMNYDYDNGFRVRTITTSSGWPTGFIHIKDRYSILPGRVVADQSICDHPKALSSVVRSRRTVALLGQGSHLTRLASRRPRTWCNSEGRKPVGLRAGKADFSAPQDGRQQG